MDQTIPQGGWWSRNWKWFVPVGCLSLLATCGCCIGGSVLFTFNSMKSSRAYQEALARAKADPDVQAALGQPIEAGLMVNFNVSARNGETVTRARIPLQGPRGEGSLHLVARERGKEVIRFERLDVLAPNNQVIHLPGVEPSDAPPGGDEDLELDDEPDDEGDAEGDGDEPDVTLEANADRPGGDFRDYESSDADPSKCALDCAGDEKCKAYTFVKPAKGKPGRCKLKERVPAKVPSTCCVSGVKQ
ncbi:MAG TPA: cytochrome c oxidase assembly factor Coa1 family protein [Myxococcales bacterium]|nr:cytochrome c oxidase assembly factor Coa1 family protein [Myxococcales bacterium]